MSDLAQITTPQGFTIPDSVARSLHEGGCADWDEISGDVRCFYCRVDDFTGQGIRHRPDCFYLALAEYCKGKG